MRLKKYLEKLRITKTLFIELLIFIILINFYFTRDYFVVCIMGNSMSPTFHDKQFVYASKKINEIKQGQIIVFKHENEVLIKRVEKVKGDIYWCAYNTPPIFYTPESFNFSTKKIEELNVSGLEKRHILDDEVFVLGDNSYESIDSRYFGPIKISDIIGVVNPVKN